MLKLTTDFSNPYPLYLQTRTQTPVFQDEQGGWHLTRYHDVVTLLTDPRFKRQSPISFGYVHPNSAQSNVDDIISKWSLFNDPPAHTRMREMLSLIIQPRLIKNTNVMIQSVAQALVASLIKQSRLDFMQAFAYPFPIGVINTLLGSSLDIATVRSWSSAISAAMDHGTLDELLAVTPIITSMQQYFHDLIKEREARLQDDWISELVKLKQEWQLSMDDLISNCIFLLLAAHETLQLSLGLGLLTLCNHREQLSLLQQQPQLIPSAIEEMLRYDAPWNKMSRWSYEDVMFDDILIPKHQLVTGIINAANRDPLRFPDPDKFDITRTSNRHLAFGAGIHVCHGALLARLELQAAFTALLPHLHKIKIEETAWLANSSLRYLSTLVISIHE